MEAAERNPVRNKQIDLDLNSLVWPYEERSSQLGGCALSLTQYMKKQVDVAPALVSGQCLMLRKSNMKVVKPDQVIVGLHALSLKAECDCTSISTLRVQSPGILKQQHGKARPGEGPVDIHGEVVATGYS